VSGGEGAFPEPLEARHMHAREMQLLGRLYERPAPTLHVVV